jgi:hypothetical protein
MKHILLVLLLWVSPYVKAQEYLPMLEEGTVWSIYIFDFFYGTSGEFQVSLEGETVINGKTYKNVYREYGGTTCFVREENGIVYRYHPNEDVETIMYDFTLELGDTFNFPDPETSLVEFCTMEGLLFTGPYEWVVTDVYTQYIAGENRKVIELDHWSECGTTATWIEGIGSSLGFDVTGDMIHLTCTMLVCYQKDGQITLFNGASSCELLGVPYYQFTTSTLYPNPVTHQAFLFVDQALVGSELLVYDMQGRLKSQVLIQRETFTINGMEYAAGMYLYQIRSKGKVVDSGKFVVR